MEVRMKEISVAMYIFVGFLAVLAVVTVFNVFMWAVCLPVAVC